MNKFCTYCERKKCCNFVTVRYNINVPVVKTVILISGRACPQYRICLINYTYIDLQIPFSGVAKTKKDSLVLHERICGMVF